MIAPNEYAQWERWTQRVRNATKKEMAQLHVQRAQAANPASIAAPFWAGLHRRWLVIKQIIWGGMPALDNWIVVHLLPHTEAAEQTLAEVGVRQQQHAA